METEKVALLEKVERLKELDQKNLEIEQLKNLAQTKDKKISELEGVIKQKK